MGFYKNKVLKFYPLSQRERVRVRGYPPELELLENPPPPNDEIDESDDEDEELDDEKLPPQFHPPPKRKPPPELDEPPLPDEVEVLGPETKTRKMIKNTTREKPAKTASLRVSARFSSDF